MKRVLITSMLAIGLGCGTAAAQTQQTESQSGADANCASGQADCQNGSKMGEQAQGKAKMKTDEQAQGKAGTTTDQQAQGKASTQDTTSTGSINNVTVEQKTQVTQIIRETKVEPVSNVNFDISVGVEVPRHKVRLHRLPARIVKIVPAYESYEYFVLADGRIVIVDPDTFKIVLILT
ncbi:DUF1236 domain-containing protein [Mesorhizobium sp. M7A.F.Ca.CA.002.03.2.1]|uniref:DUF1236 domain-containing protein n=1 Tax=Mesorhizobium sp. M7A.F.Ca.CA.002.03.2.1 TaxID=2496680 RepID=UPI000FD52843|nr:DUF1236 domain-containing protein [Mesorhizobium sp. M7A.F.Ca.CA.002.03.2.1]RVB69262.1 DUF1236 domain-containing protein [Mesorhizobium sp. M7A.F.Ca.CA.002.03.2.1]